MTQFPRPKLSTILSQILLLALLLLPTASNAGSHVVVGYWHNWGLAGVPAIKLSDVPSCYNVVCVAFASSASPSDMTMSFSPDPSIETDAQFIADVATLQSRGTKVLLSLGGQNGTVILASDAAKQTFLTTIDALIKKYGFNGIDLDLENGDVQLGTGDTDFKNPTSARLVNLIDAVRTLRTNNGGTTFWISAAPEIAYVQGGISAFAGIWGAYLPVLYGLRDILTYVHVQYYNCGGNSAPDGNTYTQGTPDFIVAMTDMLINGFGLAGSTTNVFPGFPETQVAFGLPATQGAAGGGFTQISDITKALDYLTKGISFGGKYVIRKAAGYPNLRGIMTWSINWDNTNGYAFGKAVSTYFGASTPAIIRVNHASSQPLHVAVHGGNLILSENDHLIRIDIVAPSGSCLFSIDNPENRIPISRLRSGSYLIRAITHSGTITSKFVTTE